MPGMNIIWTEGMEVTDGAFYFFKFIYFWLHWVFVAVRGLSPVAVSRGHSSLQCAGLSLRWLLLLWSMGSRHAGSVAVARER